MKYSQNDEEAYILEHFNDGRLGRFLDIGAADGKTLSNTRRLMEWGWRGVLVEPSPTIIASLYQNVVDYAGRVVVVPVAIGTEHKTIKFFDSCGDFVSTSVEAHRRKWERGGVRFVETEVDQITPRDLLDRHGYDFDFVSIDTEATNAAVLDAMPWEEMPACSLVCVEHDNRDADIVARLGPLGFRVLHRNGENLILSR